MCVCVQDAKHVHSPWRATAGSGVVSKQTFCHQELALLTACAAAARQRLFARGGSPRPGSLPVVQMFLSTLCIFSSHRQYFRSFIWSYPALVRQYYRSTSTRGNARGAGGSDGRRRTEHRDLEHAMARRLLVALCALLAAGCLAEPLWVCPCSRAGAFHDDVTMVSRHAAPLFFFLLLFLFILLLLVPLLQVFFKFFFL